MEKGTKITIAVIAVIILAILGGNAILKSVSGNDSPFSVVMSSSMQHDNGNSQLGVIDTGDIVITFNPNNATVQSYVEGTQTGYKTFGDYGSVIVYERNGQNPVIHRAIVWVEYNGNGTWSIPSFAGYKGSWNCTSGTDYMNLSGTLTFNGVTQSNKVVSIDLDKLTKVSGYLTMGDNPITNKYFDQAGSIVNYPIDKAHLKAVPVAEIPWWGVIKVYMTPDKQSYLSHVPNSIYSLVMLFVMIITIIVCSDFYFIRKKSVQMQKELNSFDDE